MTFTEMTGADVFLGGQSRCANSWYCLQMIGFVQQTVKKPKVFSLL